MPASKDEIATLFMDLAFRYGYRRTAVEDVARELRISKKTIYESFSSKQDLLRYGLELWARAQRARVESRLTEATALGRVCQATAVALADARAACEPQAPAPIPEASDLTAQINDMVFGPMVRDLLTEGVERGEFDIPDVDTTTAFLMAMGTEAVRMILADPSSQPEGPLLDAVGRLLGAAPAAGDPSGDEATTTAPRATETRRSES